MLPEHADQPTLAQLLSKMGIDADNERLFDHCVKFKNEDLGQLNANITPTTGKGNIRFNQIVFPKTH